MASQKKDEDVICESCNKSFTESTLLRHIGKKESCKSFYGLRFNEMKKKKGREKVSKFRQKPSKSHDDQLKKRREKYANDIEQKEKNRENYQKNKDKIKVANKEKRTKLLTLIARENEEKISKEEERPNILCKSYENTNELKKVFQGPFILCENCKDTFSPNSILVHISRSKVCKSHYGEKYDEIRDIMRTENMRRTSKEAWQVIKQEKDLQKEKEKKEISEELAKNSMEFFESKSRKKNSIWRKKLNWVTGCFQHLFDNYFEINTNVKKKCFRIT